MAHRPQRSAYAQLHQRGRASRIKTSVVQRRRAIEQKRRLLRDAMNAAHATLTLSNRCLALITSTPLKD